MSFPLDGIDYGVVGRHVRVDPDRQDAGDLIVDNHGIVRWQHVHRQAEIDELHVDKVERRARHDGLDHERLRHHALRVIGIHRGVVEDNVDVVAAVVPHGRGDAEVVASAVE